MAFYKNQDGYLVSSPTFLITEHTTILAGEHALHTYPTVDGWYWFESMQEAIDALGVTCQVIVDDLGEVPNYV